MAEISDKELTSLVLKIQINRWMKWKSQLKTGQENQQLRWEI
jgi:hypothetical protein